MIDLIPKLTADVHAVYLLLPSFCQRFLVGNLDTLWHLIVLITA